MAFIISSNDSAIGKRRYRISSFFINPNFMGAEEVRGFALPVVRFEADGPGRLIGHMTVDTILLQLAQTGLLIHLRMGHGAVAAHTFG